MRARKFFVAAACVGWAAAGCGLLLPGPRRPPGFQKVQVVLKDGRFLEVSSDSEQMVEQHDLESLRDRPEFVIRGHRLLIEDGQVLLDGEPLVEFRPEVRTLTIIERHGKLRIVADGRPIQQTVLK